MNGQSRPICERGKGISCKFTHKDTRSDIIPDPRNDIHYSYSVLLVLSFTFFNLQHYSHKVILNRVQISLPNHNSRHNKWWSLKSEKYTKSFISYNAALNHSHFVEFFFFLLQHSVLRIIFVVVNLKDRKEK